MEQLDTLKILGISVRTTNENAQAAHDLGLLWQRFHYEDMAGKIPHKLGNEIYAVYTDYESDYTGKYTTLIGFRVDSLETIPEGLTGREFDGGTYRKFVAKGSMPDAIVETWKKIWSEDKQLNRRYTADFEVYGDKCQNGDQSEVEIFLAV